MRCKLCGAKSQVVATSREIGPMKYRLHHDRICAFEIATRDGTVAKWVEKNGYPIVFDSEERT